LPYPEALAIAWRVSDDETVTGPLYKVEAVVGVVPSVVKWMTAFGIASKIVTGPPLS
jgi:hypothetical protein